MRRLLEEVNLQDELFMTLACNWHQRDDGVCGFLDIAFRPAVINLSHRETQNLDHAFALYLAQQKALHDMQTGALVNYARAVLDWG